MEEQEIDKVNKSLIFEEISFNLICLVVLFLPLSFWTLAYRSFSLPKALIGYLLIALLVLILLAGNLFKLTFDYKKITGLILIFLATVFLSSIFFKNAGTAFMGSYRQLAGASSWLSMALFAIAIASVKWDKSRLNDLAAVIVLTAFLVSIIGWLQFFMADVNSFFSLPVGWRPVYSTLGNATYLGAFLAFCIPVTLVMLLSAKVLVWRILFFITYTLSIGAMVFSGSRGSWIALALALFLAVTSLKKLGLKSKSIYLALGVGFLIFLASLSIPHKDGNSSSDVFSERVNQETGTFYARLGYWNAAARITSDHPFTGTGPDTFGLTYPEYSSKSSQHLEPETVTDDAHNIFLQIASTLGILALFVFLAILVRAFSQGHKVVRSQSLVLSDNSDDDKKSRQLLFGIIIGAMGYLFAIMTTVNSWGTMFIPWLFIGLMASAEKTMEKGSEETPFNDKSPVRYIKMCIPVVLLTLLLFGAYRLSFMFKADMLFAQAQTLPGNEAKIKIKKSLELWPDNEFYWLTLAKISVENPKEAKSAAVKARKVSPLSYVPNQFLAQFYLTDGASLPKSANLALKAAKRGLELFPNSRRLQGLYAAALKKSQNDISKRSIKK